MSEFAKNTAGFIGYEYKDITVSHRMKPVYADGFTNFGWTHEGTSLSLQSVGSGSVVMKFKRDRKILNKAELTRLQRQFESCVSEIERLEVSKSLGASVFAYTTGIIGTAFLAGAVFSYLAGMVPLTIILAVPGFVGWIIPYFGYLHIQRKKIEQITPLIDQKYDEIYEVCEKANNLLAKSSEINMEDISHEH
jgi:hypothetical protein